MTKSTIIALNKDSAVSVFIDDKMKRVLSDIEKEVLTLVPDTLTAKGRKEIASNAYKVSKSKTVLDEAGKTLTADWKAKAKLVDASRKEARDFLNSLRDKVRLPLTEWEEAEKLKAEQDRINREIEQAYEDAVKEDELFDREKAIAEKERIAIEAEQERFRAEEEKRIIAEKLEYERKLKEEAAIEAKKQAELEAQRKIDEANKLRIAEEERAKQAEADRLFAIKKAEDDAKQAEVDRLVAIEQAKIEQKRAVNEAEENARLEQQRVEQENIDKASEAAKIAKIKADNKAHQRSVNNKALKCFEENGIDKETARNIIIIIAEKKIAGISINY